MFTLTVRAVFENNFLRLLYLHYLLGIYLFILSQQSRINDTQYTFLNVLCTLQNLSLLNHTLLSCP